MHAGGDVFGGRVAAEHVALEHVGQLVPGHVGEVPASRQRGEGSEGVAKRRTWAQDW